MKPFRIGLLGAARITAKAIVAPAASIPTAVLAGIAARDGARAAAFANTHGVAAVYDDYAALIAAPEIDLVYNALPVDAHAAWTIRALEAGKHVLCEKPLAMNAGEARSMLAASEASGGRLIEAFHYRYHPAFGKMLARLPDIGPVQTVRAHFNVAIADNGTEIRHRPERGGGAMMDLGCYPLHWALTVMDAAPVGIDARAVITKSGVDESMEAGLSFPSGAEAVVRSSMAAGEAFSAGIEIIGRNGRIDFRNPIHPHRGASLRILTRGREENVPISRISTYAYQLDAVLCAVESGAPLPTEGADVLRQQQTLDAVYAAAGLAQLRTGA